MATNLVYRNTDADNRVETLAATYLSGLPVLSLASKPAVTVTASGDSTRSEVIPGVGTMTGIPNGGAGLVGKQVTLAFDGTWEFTAASFTGTAPVPTTIAQGTLVYITPGMLLTLTVTANTLYGYVDFPPTYNKTRGFVPVRIGV